jgi:multiple sugar transport system substrate-binding protein
MARPILAVMLGMMLGTGVTASAALAQVTITFRYAFSDGDVIRDALLDFEKKNAGIKVNLQRSSFTEARDQLVREAAVGGGPDVAHLAFVWVRDLGMTGALLPLNDLVKGKGVGQSWDDFVATNLTYDNSGKFYGVPWATDTWAMVYNGKVLKEAGITKTPETWEELRNASRQIKQRTGKTGFGFPGGAGGNNSIWFLSNFYWWSDGGTLVDQDASGKFVTGITPEKITHVFRYWDSYFKEGHNPKGNLAIAPIFDPQILEPMARGEQGIAIMPLFTYITFVADWRKRNPSQELPFYSAPTPHGSGKPTTHLGGQSLGVNAHSKHPDQAWKLVQYLTSWEFFQTHYKNYFPAQRSLLARLTFPPELNGFQEQFALARSWGPYSTGPVVIGAMWNQTARSFGSAAIGEKSFEAAGKELHDFVTEALKKK